MTDAFNAAAHDVDMKRALILTAFGAATVAAVAGVAGAFLTGGCKYYI
jgi:hypothetical protein